ncbi:hypothetical protein C345_02745 [Cryptococcus neoformans A2-102-5]|nr:hypothetical protein C346_02871 [Cryptococcus neoformans var. grubii D17-1]OXG96656.1 hypothetical protein C345_02745 [Cryptococcus neoformans var. grubii A2-102-5]
MGNARNGWRAAGAVPLGTGGLPPALENSRALPSSSSTTHNGCSPLGKVRRSPAHTPCADPATGSQSILLSVRTGVAHPDRPHAHLPATVIGAGVWLQSKTVPSEKELYSQLSPELKNKMDQIVRHREGSQTMKERLEEAGEKDQVVWGDQLNTKRKPLFPDRH